MKTSILLFILMLLSSTFGYSASIECGDTQHGYVITDLSESFKSSFLPMKRDEYGDLPYLDCNGDFRDASGVLIHDMNAYFRKVRLDKYKNSHHYSFAGRNCENISSRKNLEIVVLSSADTSLLRDMLSNFSIAEANISLRGETANDYKNGIVLSGTVDNLKSSDGRIKGTIKNARVKGRGTKVIVMIRNSAY